MLAIGTMELDRARSGVDAVIRSISGKRDPVTGLAMSVRSVERVGPLALTADELRLMALLGSVP